ncbi:MAG TPA: biopolymer transporter ExbD [Longimicrobiaceae bacterium]|nr:biopolymer transporter ExbD [Longimicrobiaceae bacterium]
MPRRRRTGRELGPMADINVTSLVDVALTLLVIFIITAPMLTGGVEVSVPRAQTAPIESPEGVVVSVDRDGEVYIGETRTAWSDFETQFPEAVRNANATSVYLRADEGVPYGRVMQVIGAMKAADVATVGLVAEPEPAAPRRR